MMAPELISAFVEEFNTELRRLAGSAAAENTAARRALADVERKIAGIMRAIEDGAYNPSLKERLTALEREKEAASARLASAQPKPIVHLHPALPDLYKRKVADLSAALNEHGAGTEVVAIIRSLIDRVMLTPMDGVLNAELFGDLATLVRFAEASEPPQHNAGSAGEPALLSVVAGIGFEPMTFRL